VFFELLEQGILKERIDGLPCPHDDCRLSVGLTRKLVARAFVLLVGGVYVFIVSAVPLARCAAGHWSRVLPAGVLPYKVFCVRAQEFVIEGYSSGDLALRSAVGLCIGRAPHFTTLWGWLGGLGSMALGRTGSNPAAPIALVREETKRRLLPQLDTVWEQPVVVNPARVQQPRQTPMPGKMGVSKAPEVRLEQLEAVVRVLRTAQAVAKAAGHATAFALAMWVGLFAGFDIVPGISWWARSRGTSFILSAQSASRIASSEVQELGNKEAPCPSRTRPPPGNAN
jgi:hypothetical protein